MLANNGEIQARWSLARGGLNFDLIYDPEKGVIKVRAGSSNVPIYHLFKALGITDAAMARGWGQDVYDANLKAARPQNLKKLHELFTRRSKATTPTDMEAAIRKYFTEETEVWPDAMKAALGKEFNSVTGESLMLSSKKLLAIQRGRSKDDPPPSELPDDRQILSACFPKDLTFN